MEENQIPSPSSDYPDIVEVIKETIKSPLNKPDMTLTPEDALELFQSLNVIRISPKKPESRRPSVIEMEERPAAAGFTKSLPPGSPRLSKSQPPDLKRLPKSLTDLAGSAKSHTDLAGLPKSQTSLAGSSKSQTDLPLPSPASEVCTKKDPTVKGNKRVHNCHICDYESFVFINFKRHLLVKHGLVEKVKASFKNNVVKCPRKKDERLSTEKDGQPKKRLRTTEPAKAPKKVLTFEDKPILTMDRITRPFQKNETSPRKKNR